MVYIITKTVFSFILLYFAYSLIKWLVWKRKRLNVFRSAGIPGPSPFFWTGNTKEYMSNQQVALDRWTQKYGPRFGYFFGSMPYLVLSDVDEIQELLVKKGKSVPNRQTAVLSVEPFKSSLLDARGNYSKLYPSTF